MRLPIIITNFKTFESATGEKALALAKIHEKVARETGASMAVAVQAVDVFRISQAVAIPVLGQTVEAVNYGSATGHILPEALQQSGAVGALLNHSECRAGGLENIVKILKRCQEVGLELIVCAENPEEGRKIAELGASLVAVEPPELIGGEVSVSKARPEVISEAVGLIGQGKVIVGAGVKTGEDVRIAIKLGASGVLLASGVTKAGDPEAVLRDLVAGLK